MTESEDQPVLVQDGVGHEASPIRDGLVLESPGDQGRPSHAFGPWSSVALAFPVAAAAELAFLLVSSRLFSGGGSSSAMISSLEVMILLPFIIGGVVIWHVVLGLVMGAILGTMPALLGVWTGVLLGAWLDSVVGPSEANVGTVAILSLCVLFFVLPGYRVGVRLQARRPRT